MSAAFVPRTSEDLRLSGRDRRIIDLAMSKTRGERADFGDAMRALREAVKEVIPDGRIFFLGNGDHGPIVGSILSGVGIVESEHGIQLVRVQGNGCQQIGWFTR